MSTSHPMLEAYKPTPADPFDRMKAAHLLNRAGFGGTAVEIDKVMEMGPQSAADWLLDFPDAGADEQSQSDVPNLSSIDGYPRDFRELQKMMGGMNEGDKKLFREKIMMANREALQATGSWWLKRMAYGPRPLQEKLTLFWHGHFTTSAKDERSALLMWRQNELLRQNAVGNFKKFVRAISRDPAMLDYLNNAQNRKAHPNENYARELMELFTLGIGNYTEKDVKEAARAFTGWAHDGDDYIFRKFDHDDDEKVFLGRRGPFDGDDIVDIILATPTCGRYIASKLFRFFANDAVDASLGNALGDLLRTSKYEMRPLMRTILTSKAFYSPASIGCQIKSPVQLVIGTIRMLNLEMPPTRALQGPLNQMGQVPFAPPNVKGWPGGRLWINTSTLFVRQNTAIYLAGNGPMLTTIVRKPGGGKGNQRPVQVAPVEFHPGVSNDSSDVVDQWVAQLIQRPIAEEKREVLIQSLEGRPDREESVRKMVQLIVSMPEYQLC